MNTRRLRAAIYGLVAVPAMLLAGVARPWAPAARAATAACPSFTILGTRASGQSTDPNVYDGIGVQADAFVQSFIGLEGLTSGQYTIWSNPYPAVPINGIDGVPNMISAVLGWGAYTNSVQRGQDLLTAEINSVEQSCGTTTKIILVGFSQAAQLVGNVDASLDSAQLSGIAGVALFGDPLFDPSSPAARGSFNTNRRGLLTHPSGHIRATFPNPARVIDYCFGDDPVCQGFINLSPFGSIAGTGSHSNYNTRGDSTNPAPYTTQAAQNVVNMIAQNGAARRAGTASPADSQLPGAPTNITVTGFTATTATLSWSPPSSGPAALGYEVYGTNGVPLTYLVSPAGGSVTVPLEEAPPGIDIQSLNSAGEGGIATVTFGGSQPDTVVELNGSPGSIEATPGDYDFSVYATAGESITLDASLPAGSSASHLLLNPSADIVVPDTQISSATGSLQTLISSYAVTTSGVYTLYLDFPGTGPLKVQATS
jgi:hypothetical protein